jgi:predicted nucleic acid-binding protein
LEKILADSCIFIDIFRGNHQLYHQLSTLNVSINSIIYMELIQGAKNKTELKEYGLLIPDAVIAATAVCKGYKLWTFNLKDYKFIKNLVLFEL